MIGAAIAIVGVATSLVGAEPFVVRSTAQCRDDAHPVRVEAHAVAGGVKLTVPVSASSPCNTAHGTLSTRGTDAFVALTVDSDAMVETACEAVCPAVLVVDTWIRAPKMRVAHVSTAGATTDVSLEPDGAWVAHTAPVQITSEPSDAAVFRDGNRAASIGRTPLTLPDEPRGAHSYILVKGDQAAFVSVDVGAAHDVHARLGDRSSLPRSDRVVGGRVTAMKSQLSVSNRALSKDDVVKVVNAHIGEVQYCYEKQLQKKPGLAGRVVFEWTVNAVGHVVLVKSSSSSLNNVDVTTCIMGKIKSWKFPQRMTEEAVTVSFPFVFNPV